MGFYIGALDNKQHLNLSELAWIRIEEDMHMFDQAEKNSNLSGFINRVFTNFYETSKASLSYRLDDQSEYYEQVFSKLDKTHQVEKKSIIHTLLDTYIKDTLNELSNYPKGIGKKFRINNENALILERSIDDAYYEGSISTYLKYMLEEYVRLPIYERESIYYNQNVRKIKDAIKSNHALSVILESNRAFLVKAYDVIIDKTATFNYLVGYARPITLSSNEPFKLSTFRISRIKALKTLRSKSGKITESERKALTSVLQTKGPQFLSGDDIEVAVKLTKEGIRKYNTQITLRPLYSNIIDQYTYVFNCTESQILYYFFKFGRDATILSPQYLKDKFKKFYRNALNNYEVLE